MEIEDNATLDPAIRRELMRMLAAEGGKARTEAKRKASAENGKKGGRPKKNPEKSLDTPCKT